MSNEKQSNKVAIIVALIPAVAVVIGALIANWDKVFPNQSLCSVIALTQGEWEITEQLKSQKDSTKIFWIYQSNILNNTLRMRGKKIKVNDKEPTESEKKAISVFNLTFKGYQAEGEFEESNSKDNVLRGTVKINFSEKLTSLSGHLYENGREVSTLVGNKN
jgi:hypothetical protein